MLNMIDNSLLNWILLPLFIFVARIIDVSIGTLRIIFMSRGRMIFTPLLGFIEILIWLIAIRQIFNNLNNPLCYIAFAGGFATGNYVGMWLDNKIAMGLQVVRIITRYDASALVHALKENGFGITHIEGEGLSGKVKIIFTLIQRRNLPEVISMVKNFNPKAFFSVEDVRMASEKIFPKKALLSFGSRIKWLKMEKKGK